MMIKAAERILNSDKICRNYSDLNFGVTFFGRQCILYLRSSWGRVAASHIHNRGRHRCS